MNKKQLEKLIKARHLIFEVEQEWRKEVEDNPELENRAYGAETLYRTRIELNNAMSRG
jgi:hypothetical protein